MGSFSSRSPKELTSTRTIFTRIGQTKTLTCPYDTPSNVHVTSVRWEDANSGRFIGFKYKDGDDKYIDSQKYNIDSFTSLTIRKVTLSDESKYRCMVTFKATNGKDEQGHGFVKLKIYSPFKVSLDLESKDQTTDTMVVIEKTMFNATCKTSKGRPETNFTWYFNDEPISKYRHLHAKISMGMCKIRLGISYDCSSILFIKQVKTHHTGKYSCKAEIIGMETEKQEHVEFILEVKTADDHLLLGNGGQSLQSSTRLTWFIQMCVTFVSFFCKW
ncbi:uncharacterized protein LOC144435594 isoform X2 [Glandiceps talaboti]